MTANNSSTAGRTALITGASRGFGLALARGLARDGWQLLIDARGANALEAARRELADLTNVVALPGDVRDAGHRAELVSAAAQLGGLDLLVNNAGILGPSPQPALTDYPPDVLAVVFETNVIAPLALIQAAQHEFKPGATVINITSDAAVEAYEGWGGYGAAKAALEQIAHTCDREARLARVLGRSGRHAHADAPGGLPRRGYQRPSIARRERARLLDLAPWELPERAVPGTCAHRSDDRQPTTDD